MSLDDELAEALREWKRAYMASRPYLASAGMPAAQPFWAALLRLDEAAARWLRRREGGAPMPYDTSQVTPGHWWVSADIDGVPFVAEVTRCMCREACPTLIVMQQPLERSRLIFIAPVPDWQTCQRIVEKAKQ